MKASFLPLSLIVGVLVVLLTACGAGQPDIDSSNIVQPPRSVDHPSGAAPCSNTLATAETVVAATCTFDCDLSTPTLAVDGDGTTYAELLLEPTTPPDSLIGLATQRAAIRATLPLGLTLPAGEIVGVKMRPASSSTLNQQSLQVATYLAGDLQDLFWGYNNVNNVYGASDQQYLYEATKAFDAVEVIYMFNATDGTTKSIRLYEICG